MSKENETLYKQQKGNDFIADVSERLYSMKLGDDIELENSYIKWHVTRVPSGWIYSHIRLDSGQMNTVFVPFDNVFQNAR
jgi:hypothetical protein